MSEFRSSRFQSSSGCVMLRVPSGSFTLGSPEDEDVTFAGDFLMGKYPVTQAEYQAVMGENPTDHELSPDAPVDAVNWDMADGYCRQLTQIDQDLGLLPGDWEYRLPAEAEWEYVCRAGSSEPRYGELSAVAWFCDNAEDKPHTVGQKLPNAWGFHDMLGNVWEWCQDWFLAANPCRSVRGGSYFNSARFCRAAQRWGWMPGNRGRYCGFRLLAAPISLRPTEANFTPPQDQFEKTPDAAQPPSIHHCIETDNFELANQIAENDSAALHPVDFVPPPLQSCVYQDKPAWVEWLLNYGANIEQREQDYGATPLTTAIVMRRKSIIRILIERGADCSQALDHAHRGLAGAFEDDPRLDRDGYREIIVLLAELGIE